MPYLIVEIANQSSSFRNPDFQNFHKSYELPPPTTLIGFAGAALGLSPKTAQDYFNEDFELGIAGVHLGKSNDLWKYQKLKGKEFISDILIREIHFENKFVFVFGHDNISKIKELESAFRYPSFALTLGNSDSLAKICAIKIEEELVLCDKLENCVVEGNILQEVLNNPESMEFSLHDGIDPISHDVPIEFSYHSDYGIRRVIKRKELSFIGPTVYVNGFIFKGIRYKKYQIPLFKIHA